MDSSGTQKETTIKLLIVVSFRISVLFSQISFLHSLIIQKVGSFSFFYNLAGLQNITSVCDGQGFLCVLLYQKNGGSASADLFDNIENLVYENRGETHGGLIHEAEGFEFVTVDEIIMD